MNDCKCVPNMDMNLCVARYVRGPGGEPESIYIDPIVSWAIHVYTTNEGREFSAIPVTFDGYLGMGEGDWAIFDQRTDRWWIPEMADGAGGKQELLDYWKSRRPLLAAAGETK